MKKNYLLLLLVMLSFNLKSQIVSVDSIIRADSLMGWRNGGMIMLNLSQASFTNWSAGGENLLSYNGLINYFSKYTGDEIVWDNTIDIALGFVHQNDLSKKSDDRLDLSSKIGKSINNRWYYAGLLNFKTQFRPGYNSPNDSVKISNFLAPAYLILALGFDYRPNPFLSVFIAPVTGRLTIVNDQVLADSGAFGVDPGNNSRLELGAYTRFLLQKENIFTNVNLSTKFEAFSNYLENPQNLVLNWELLITLKVNRYLGATVTTQLMYDDAVKYMGKGPRVQFREVIGVGLSYQF